MRTKDAVNWPPADEEQLRRMWDVEGRTSGYIGKVMGRTRNSIIGKVVRMKLSKRQHPERARAPRPPQRGPRPSRAKHRSKPRVTRPAPVLPVHALPAGNPWEPAPGMVPVTLMELGDGICRWAVTEDRPFLFCGQPTAPGKSYCQHHVDWSVGNGTSFERAAVATAKSIARCEMSAGEAARQKQYEYA